MQDSLRLIRESWTQANQEFEESGMLFKLLINNVMDILDEMFAN